MAAPDYNYNRLLGVDVGKGLKSLLLGMRSSTGWRSLPPFVLLLLAFLVGGIALSLSTSSGARADDPPPTTVTTATLPTPVPAPIPAPVVKPPNKKASPPPHRTVTRTTRKVVSHPAAVAPTSTQTPLTVASHPSRPTVKVKTKPKRTHRAHRKVIRHPRKAPAAKVQTKDVLGASVRFLPQGSPSSDGSGFQVGSLLLILGCALAIACFSIAVVPARAVPWRPVAIFLSERQLDVTLAGLALLVATLTFYFIAGPR